MDKSFHNLAKVNSIHSFCSSRGCLGCVHTISVYEFRKAHSIPALSNSGEIQEAMKEMDEHRKTLERKKEDLEKGKFECINKIKHIMDRLHQLELATIEITEEMHNHAIAEINNDMKRLIENVDALETIHENLESALNYTAVHSAIINHSKVTLAKVQKLNLELKYQESKQLEFIPNQELENLLQGIKLLGTIQKEIVGSDDDVQNFVRNVELPADVKDCDIRSICVARTGDIFAVDYENRSLIKVKNRFNNETRSIKFNGRPLHVRSVNEEEILVCLEERVFTGSRYKLQFISTQDELKTTREAIKLDHPCTGLAVAHDKIFVSDNQEMVYIYSMNARSARVKIFKDKAGLVIFKQSRAIAVNEEKDKIYVINGNNGLVVLERNGDVAQRLQLCLNQIQDICIGNHGIMFIADNTGIKMFKLSPDNKTAQPLIGAPDLNRVQAMCYSESNRMLTTATKGSNMLHQLPVP